MSFRTNHGTDQVASELGSLADRSGVSGFGGRVAISSGLQRGDE